MSEVEMPDSLGEGRPPASGALPLEPASGRLEPRLLPVQDISIRPEHPVAGTTVRVQIDRLALEGFNLEPGQQRVLVSTLQDELGRLLSNQTLPHRFRSGGATPHLPGGVLHISASKDPAGLGREIALALYGGLQR